MAGRLRISISPAWSSEVAVVVEELGGALLRGVLPARLGDGEFAVVAQRLAVGEGVVPDEAGGRIGQRVHVVVFHAVRVAAREAGEGAFHVVGGEGGVGPLMAVGAEDAGAVGVVEQHELAGQLVLVGRDALAEDAEGRVAVALFHVAQHLVVGAVLLDDVDDVLEDARFAHALGHGARRLAGARRQGGLLEQRIAHVGQRRAGVGRQLAARRARSPAKASRGTGASCCRCSRAGSSAAGGSDAFEVGDVEQLPSRVVNDGAREPADRDQAKQAAICRARSRTTATAFCVPLQTKSRLPDLSKASALG